MKGTDREQLRWKHLLFVKWIPPSVYSHMRLWKYRFTILLPYSACCSFPLIPPPSMRYVHHMCLSRWSLYTLSLSQYWWGRWKHTTTPVAAAARQKHCFLGNLPSRGSIFFLLWISVYHYRPLRSLAGLLSLRAQHLHQGWRIWRFEQSPLTYQNDSKEIWNVETLMKNIVEVYSCDAMKQIISGANQILVIRNRRQN